MDMENTLLREDIYDLYGYMASAAKELLVDPQIYGPFRMVDTISRVITLLDNHGFHDDFSQEIKNFIDANKYVMMSDEDEFADFLNKLVVKFAEKSVE